MKRFVKYFFVSVSAVMVLLLFAGLFTMTPIFRSWLSGKIIDATSSSIDATLEIGSIGGNLFSDIDIRSIVLRTDVDTIAFIPRLVATYSLSGILNGRIQLHTVTIDSPSVKLTQHADSSWRLFSARNSGEDTETAPSNAPSSWNIVIEDIQLRQGTIRAFPLDSSTLIPRRVYDIEARCSGTITNDLQELTARQVRFRSEPPEIRVTDCSISIGMSDAGISVTGFALNTAANALHGEGFISAAEAGPSKVSLRASSLDLAEFGPMVPPTLRGIRPSILADIVIRTDSVEFRLSVDENSQHARITGTIAQRAAVPLITLKADVDHIDLGRWTGEKALASSINGSFEGEATLKNVRTGKMRVRARLDRSEFMKRRIGPSLAEARLERGDLRASLETSGRFGSIGGDVVVRDLFGTQNFGINLHAHHLDLAEILLDAGMRSDLSGSVRATGSGLSAATLRGAGNVELQSSRFGAYGLDAMSSSFAYQNRYLTVDSFRVRAAFSTIRGRGSVREGSGFDIDCSGEVTDLIGLQHLLRADTLSGHGNWSLHLGGTADSLRGSATAEFQHGTIDSLKFGRARSSVSVEGSVKNPVVHYSVAAMNPSHGAVHLDSIRMDGAYTQRILDANVSFSAGDSLAGSVSAVADIDSQTSIVISSMQLRLNRDEWQLKNDSTVLTLAKGWIAVRNFLFTSDEQSIRIDGRLGEGLEDTLRVGAQKLRLGALRPVLGLPQRLEGTLDVACALSGSLDRPAIETGLEVSAMRVGSAPIGEVRSAFSFRDSAAAWTLRAMSPTGRAIVSEGAISLSIDSSTKRISIDTARPLKIMLEVDSLDLSFLRGFLQTSDSLDGILSARLDIEGNGVTRRARGNVSLSGGTMVIPRLGIAYRSAAINLSLLDSLLGVAGSMVTREKGSMEVTGRMISPRGLLGGDGGSLELKLLAKKFEVVRSDDLSIVMDGTVGVTSDARGLMFEGAIEIPQSRWYLPAFLRQFQNANAMKDPMLVRATNRSDSSEHSSQEQRDKISTIDIGIPVNGKMRVHIPRGTWIESPKLFAELSGDLTLRVIDSKPAVSGSIEIERGWAQMFGVRLTFLESRITMKEGGEMIPDVAIKMEYTFRDQNREKKSLNVNIRGNARDPEIIFTLDNREIKQEDALSYMLFGKSSSDISSNQLSDLNNSASQMMEQMTSSIISSKLSATVGKSLGMDVIELRGTDNWSKASLTGGKYVNDQLFVSFEKGFGKYEANETIPQMLTVEYELFRFLFLQLISGTDEQAGMNVIVKFDTGVSR